MKITDDSWSRIGNQRFTRQMETNESIQILLKLLSWAYERSLVPANHYRCGNGVMDMTAANLIEKAIILVISSGYFGNRFKDIFI
jgi:aspartate aminotransferase-like enzyme